MFDKFREECGLMGVWGHPEASNLAYLGLYAQQHRGQEGAGVVSCSNGQFYTERGMGLVAEVFHKNYDFSRLPGDRALGHVRYTTAGGNFIANVQPFYSELAIGKVAIAHNGNLINTDPLKDELIKKGAIFTSTSDTEVVLHLLARAPTNVPLVESVISALQQIRGAYSLIMMFEDQMFALRDPNGVRPLAIGRLGEGYVFASETCAFDLVGAQYVRDVRPGEIVAVDKSNNLKSYFPFGNQPEAPCVFEYVYFARPDSNVFGRNVYGIRKRMGQELAREHPAPGADLVIPVPDSGVTAALGFAAEAKIPLEMGLIRNHYIGRTFIEPKQSIRDFGVKLKLNANPDILKDRSIVVVDDSIVRGTTSRKLMNHLRQAGAREIHLRISAPPTTDPCYYGIDTPSKEELIASRMTIPQIAEYIGVDTLGYLSIDGLYRAVQAQKGKFCDACFSGCYPLGTPGNCQSKQQALF